MKYLVFLFVILQVTISCSGESEKKEIINNFNVLPNALALADSNFNPDDAGMSYVEMREKYGDISVPEGEILVGAVSKAFENEYWRMLKLGMETAGEKINDLGYNVNIDVRSAQSENDEQGQLSVVKDMINKKYSILLLSPISDGNLTPGLEESMRKSIPVINVNDGIIPATPFFVGPRAIENGELAAKWISDEIGGEGDVAIVVGLPKAFAARQRTLGFENWMKENAPNINIVEKQNADWDRLKSKDIADIWIKKHKGNLKAIFVNNDTMALGVQEAVNISGQDILVVGVDGIGEAYDSIRKGELDATIDSYPLYKGQIAVEAAMRVLSGQDIPRVIWTPQRLIDSSNVDIPTEEILDWKEPKYK